jgi:hypothetical protein
MLRIGIILSLIWFVGFGAYMWFSSIQQLNDLYSLDLRACSENFDRTGNSINYEYCMDEAREVYLGRFNVHKERIPRLLLLDFGTVAFAWSVALIGILISGWIRRGFQR